MSEVIPRSYVKFCFVMQWDNETEELTYLYSQAMSSVNLLNLHPGGTQIWVGQRCAARVSKPIPIFKGDFGQNGYPFLRIFLQKEAYFFKNSTIFGVFAWRKPRKSRNLGLSQKSWPMFKDFLGKKTGPMFKDFL